MSPAHAQETWKLTPGGRPRSGRTAAYPDARGCTKTIVEFIRAWEWVLLVAVIALQIGILVNAVREGRERKHLLREMENTRVELGRESCAAMKRSALMNAGQHLCFVSRTANSDIDNGHTSQSERLNTPSVRYRCITATDPSLLRRIFDLHLKGVEVRVSPSVILSTFRFHTWDDRGAVMGFSGEAEEDDVRGIEAMNPHFSRILRHHFDGAWGNATPWQQWAREVLHEAQGPDEPVPIAELAAQWSLDEDYAAMLEEVLAAPAAQRARAGRPLRVGVR
ncbi:MAG: hypothetical protein ABFC80_03155 [Coriobacteriales bacterium]